MYSQGCPRAVPTGSVLGRQAAASEGSGRFAQIFLAKVDRIGQPFSTRRIVFGHLEVLVC